MSPTGLVFPRHHSQRGGHEKPSMLTSLQNNKRDDNSHSSSSNSDSNNGSSSHRSSGSNDGSGKDGGSGSSSSDGGGSDNNSGHGSTGSSTGSSSGNSNTSNFGSNTDNSPGGGFTQFKTVTATLSASASVDPLSFPSATLTGVENLAPTTSLITSSASVGPSSPSSPSTTLSPTEQQTIHHVSLPLGSIVAIILGILFCITISAVIYVVTRPKFGSLGRLWRNPRVSSPYLPSIASYEPKEIRDSSNLYRPYQPQARPLSHSMFNSSSFQFASQGAIAAQQGHRLGNNGTPMEYNDVQTQIYSTRKPGSSSPQADRSLESLHAGESEDQSLESLYRIMSMVDKCHFERNSSVDSGQISPTLSDSLPLHANHHNHAGLSHTVYPDI